MWRELIEIGLQKNEFKPTAKFNQPATFFEILIVEELFGVKFPDELKSLLKETNGVSDEYGCGYIWSTERIQQENLQMRNESSFKDLYMPFDCLLFFGDAGNGDLFAFSVLNNEIRRNDVFVWNHEDDSRSWIAPNLKRYLELWLSGNLEF